MRYYEISASHMSPLSPVTKGGIRGAVCCEGCGSFLGQFTAVDIKIQGRTAGRHGLNFVQGCSNGGVAKKRLLESLDPEVVASLVLGAIIADDDRILPDVVTYRARERIVVRGQKHTSHRVCSECGAICYFAMDQSYLFPAPDPDVVVFESGFSGLVIRGDHFSRERLLKLPGVRIAELEVVDEPRDGLAALKAMP